MGAELPPAAKSATAPIFVVSALKDAGTAEHPGTDLERIQLVKLWEENGEARERVHDLARSAAGIAGVDLATCETHGRGATSLCSVWRDPDFDPAQHALYYARVLENPTCRWSTWVCNAHRVDCSERDSLPGALAGCCDDTVPRTVRERAWTSPIWYVAPLAQGALEREPPRNEEGPAR
jgi:hypothetical protein